MQKFNIPCIRTGDFAKLCNTNKRTLIHYDEIGLFSPAYTDEKGYRYYTETQCDVFFTITCLKEIGMPLKEIKAYIDTRNAYNLKELLLEQHKKLQREMEHLKRMEQVIQTKLQLVTSGENLVFEDRLSPVYIEKHPEEYLIVSPYLDTNHRELLFQNLCQHLGKCNKMQLNTGHPYGAMMNTTNLLHKEYDTYAYFFTKIANPPENYPYEIKPQGDYVTIYLKGDYYHAEEAFEKLLRYFSVQKLIPGPYCYKEAIWDELTVQTEEDFVTRISIQVISTQED